MEHPSLALRGNKKCPKRLRRVASAQRAGQRSDEVEVIRDAAKTHIENGECLWLHFEQAYSYYKLGKFDRALYALKLCADGMPPRELHRSDITPLPSLDGQEVTTATECQVTLDPTLSEKYGFLLAQIYFRLGRFNRARDIYNITQKGEEDPLVSLNALSVDLNLAADLDSDAKRNLFMDIDRHMDKRIDKGDGISYEFFYNWAIAKILEGDYDKAENYLDLAEERLSSELKDELGEDHTLHTEPSFVAIEATRVYLLDRRNCQDLAKKRIDGLWENFKDSDSIDPGILMIVLNSWLSLCIVEEVGDMTAAVSRLEALLKNGNVNCKFTKRELLDIHHNIVARLIASGNSARCKVHMMKFMDFLKKDAFLHNGLASVEYSEGRVDSSISVLKRGISINKKSILLMHSVVSVLLAEGRYTSTLRTVQLFAEELKASGYSAFYWGTLLDCYIYLRHKDEVVNVLNELLECEYSQDIAAVLQRGCKFLESQGMYDEARKIHSALYDKEKKDTVAYCGILFNESFMDIDEGIAFTLPVAISDSLFKDLRFIDAEELEAEGKMKIRKHTMDERKVRKSRRRKRVKKVDTSRGPPDPERWLPKYQRAAFKKMMKRKKDATRGNTQGSTTYTSSSKPTSVTISTDTAASQNRRRRNRKK